MSRIRMSALLSGLAMRICVLSILLSTFHCSATKPWFGDEKSGFILQYRYEGDGETRYQAVFEQNYFTEFSGRSYDLGSVSKALLAMAKTGEDSSGSNVLNITVEELDMALTGSLGERSLEDGGLKGRRFPLTLTRNGEISDFGGSDTLKVSLNLNGPGRYTVKEFFENYTGSFFPVLPTGPRKIGETWEGGREFNQNIGGFDILFQIESVTTLEGFESVGTIRCLKLQSEGQFVAEGSASEGRRRLDGEGEIQTITLFDYQTGRLIRHDLDFFGEFTMAQAQAGTIPATLESKIHVQQRF